MGEPLRLLEEHAFVWSWATCDWPDLEQESSKSPEQVSCVLRVGKVEGAAAGHRPSLPES